MPSDIKLTLADVEVQPDQGLVLILASDDEGRRYRLWFRPQDARGWAGQLGAQAEGLERQGP